MKWMIKGRRLGRGNNSPRNGRYVGNGLESTAQARWLYIHQSVVLFTLAKGFLRPITKAMWQYNVLLTRDFLRTISKPSMSLHHTTRLKRIWLLNQRKGPPGLEAPHGIQG